MTTIDLRTIPASIPSLCIPRVFANIGEARIRGIFEELNMGEIERVDIISKTTDKGDKFNRVFIHFKHWGTDGNAEKARQRLLNGQDIKIVYDDPWFWKISAYRPPAAASQPQPNRRPQQKAPRLELDESERPPQRPDNRQRPPQRPDNRQRPPQRDNRQRPQRDNRQRPQRPQRPPQRDDRQRPDNRSRTPDTSPPREENDIYDRPMDQHELAEHEEINRKNAEVAQQLGIETQPAIHKRAIALKNMRKSLSIKMETEAVEQA
jgi:hypothetical protein